MITSGIDWAEAHHNVALVNEGGSVLARARIDTGVAGSSDLLALIAEHGGDPETTPIAIETANPGRTVSTSRSRPWTGCTGSTPNGRTSPSTT